MKVYKRYAYQIFLKLFGDISENKYDTKYQNSKEYDINCIYKKENVVVLGYYGVCITNKVLILPFALKKTILNILTKHYRFAQILNEYIKRAFKMQKSIRADYDKVFYLVARHGRRLESPNYAHWLLENLPMVYMYLQEQQKGHTFLLVRAKSPIWIYDSLELLGVNKKNIIETSQKILCNELIYCKIPYVHSWSYIRAGFLRNWVSTTHKLMCNLNVNEPQLIVFLSRQKSIIRRIKNFTEVEEVLKMHNVVIVDTEKVSLKDQISLLSNTKCMIAQPGAAMANMIYMPKNSKVMELTPKKPFDTWLWKELAKEMQHEYLIYEPEFSTDVRSDIAINTSNFNQALTDFLDSNIPN